MPKGNAKKSAFKAAPGPREHAHALIDALPDAALQDAIPYLEFLMQPQRQAAKRSGRAPAADSMPRDMGL